VPEPVRTGPAIGQGTLGVVPRVGMGLLGERCFAFFGSGLLWSYTRAVPRDVLPGQASLIEERVGGFQRGWSRGSVKMSETVERQAGVCAGCGVGLPPSRGNRPRKWCSEGCRKASYGDPCVDCGARTCSGAEKARVAEPRCPACSYRHRSRWTEEVIVARIREWVAVHGEPPAKADWTPADARRCNDEERALRFERADGYWPCGTSVIERFGSWSAAVVAAGFVPRPRFGVAVNHARRRSAA
jgi:hypothetical protein